MRATTSYPYRRWTLLLALALVVTACGPGSQDGSPDATPTPAGSAATETPVPIASPATPQAQAEGAEPGGDLTDDATPRAQEDARPTPTSRARDTTAPVAVGIPLQIPLPQNGFAGPFEENLPEIERRVREACGGDLCLTIVTRVEGAVTTPPPGQQCQEIINRVDGAGFDEDGNPGPLIVERGGEFVVIVELDCTEALPAPVPPASPTSTDQDGATESP